MAMRRYYIEDFMGIDQSSSENKLASGFSPDACNMDTENGDLAVGKGYSKHLTAPVPGEGRIWRMYHWHTCAADRFVVAAGDSLYAYASGEWGLIYTYPSTITSTKWDFKETRIGDVDHLVIANGQTQLVKWSGSGMAQAFGTGEYVHETTLASVTHNATMAESATYDETLGEYVLTMQEGWAYAANARVLFTCPADVGRAESVRLRIGGSLYTLETLPTWKKNDAVILTLTGATTVTAVVPAKAESVAYTEATGTYALVMPSGWVYAQDTEIAFTTSAAVGTATSVKITAGGGAYTFAVLPTWTNGALVIAKLTSTTAAEEVAIDRPAGVTFESSVGVYSLTMPSGWAYAQDRVIAFPVPLGTDYATVAVIRINAVEYTLTTLPGWLNGDTGLVKLTGAARGEILDSKYGIDTVTLADAIPAEWVARANFVGLRVDGLTYYYTALSADRKTATLRTVCARELAPGVTVQVRGGVSDAPVGYIEIHASRLFSAGDARYPSRLYWSQPPGDERTIEDWSMDDASDLTSGGHTEVGNTSSDPIVGLCSLSSQLLIFKKHSIYRLLGDRPNNYKIVQVNLGVEPMVNSGLILYGDVPYWITRSGLYYHDGQQALLTPTARQIQYILDGASIDNTKSAECRSRFYFTLKRGTGDYDDSIVVYDVTRRTYMLRNGFSVIDICADNGKLYMINDARYVYVWDDGHTYDGVPIDAYWKTPMTDMGRKDASKALKVLYLRGEGRIFKVEYTVGRLTRVERYQIPADEGDVVAVALRNEGRAFRFKIFNEKGSFFRLTGGVEVHFELKENH